MAQIVWVLICSAMVLFWWPLLVTIINYWAGML